MASKKMINYGISIFLLKKFMHYWTISTAMIKQWYRILMNNCATEFVDKTTVKNLNDILGALMHKKRNCNIKHFIVCSCHVTYAFQSESTLYSCLNVKEWSRRKIWRWSDCNWTRTQNHLVLKRTLNHLAKLAKWSSCVLIELCSLIS